MKFAVALPFALVVVGSAAVVRKGGNFLSNGMQPEVVARTLASVEEEWKAQASIFARCNASSSETSPSLVNCADGLRTFDKSCSTVVAAIIQGSGGDRSVAKEYMNDVCSQKAISGWHQQQCQALATAVQGFMTADKYENREHFNTAKLCNSFWVKFFEEEKERMNKESADREAAEKKAFEEAANQEKAHEEELKKQTEAEQAAAKEAAEKEAAHKKDEEKTRAELEAKLKAAEAGAKLAQKKAEAEAVAAAAQAKKEEAEMAEREHTQAMANLTAVKSDHVAKDNSSAVNQTVESAPDVTVAAPTASPVTAVNVTEKIATNTSSATVNTTK